MNNKLEKKFGLLTAICMVVGIVIGSGVFFKAQSILQATEGNMPLGILAWVIGGVVMLICCLNFSTLATRYERVNGIVDYAEATVGKKYAYYVGWFITTIYYPAMTSVLAWLSADYTLRIFPIAGYGSTSGLCLALAALYLMGSYFLNAVAPRLAGKFQVSTTFIKLVPLFLMAIAGTVAGLINGNTQDAFASTGGAAAAGSVGSPLFGAVVATAFAYEGWIIATAINSELKNAKRNLPIALTVGCLIIVAVYITYYIGLAGAVPVEELVSQGATHAFTALFGRVGGTVLNVFIAISCLGTLNGLMFAASRGMYAISVRGEGPRPDVFSEVSPTTNMPANASAFGVFLCALWLFYFFGANLWNTPLFGLFSFDSSELPIITIYGIYIPIFVRFIRQHGRENRWRNTVMPILAILASAFMIFCAIYAHGIVPYRQAAAEGRFSFPVLFYLIVFTVVMLLGGWFYRHQGIPAMQERDTADRETAEEE